MNWLICRENFTVCVWEFFVKTQDSNDPLEHVLQIKCKARKIFKLLSLFDVMVKSLDLFSTYDKKKH